MEWTKLCSSLRALGMNWYVEKSLLWYVVFVKSNHSCYWSTLSLNQQYEFVLDWHWNRVIIVHMWPAEWKSGTSRKYWIWVRGNFIRTGRFPAKLRLLHQRVTGSLDCIILNYEAQLYYYKDDVSLNSQACQSNMGTRYYGQLVCVFQKTWFYQLPVQIRLLFRTQTQFKPLLL